MDDKVFNLLEKMYSEFTEFKQDITSKVTKIEMTLETDVKPNIKMCLDELVSVKEKQTEHDSRFDSIESKIEKQDVEISVIKRVI
jgi:peptidoglycan hydrolase CwlO-like protein